MWSARKPVRDVASDLEVVAYPPDDVCAAPLLAVQRQGSGAAQAYVEGKIGEDAGWRGSSCDDCPAHPEGITVGPCHAVELIEQNLPELQGGDEAFEQGEPGLVPGLQAETWGISVTTGDNERRFGGGGASSDAYVPNV